MSYHLKNIYVLLIISVLSTTILQAQQVKSITKTEVLAKVAEQNTSLKVSEQEFNEAKADYRQTNAILLPNISVSHTGIATTNPLMAFGSKLNQEILTQNDFNPLLLNDPDQIKSFATKIEVQQPILNLDGMYQRKATKTKMQAVALQKVRTNDYLLFEVDRAYMQLQLAYKAVDVLEKALKATLENKQMKNRIIKGVAGTLILISLTLAIYVNINWL